jgi:hypothetical protein
MADFTRVREKGGEEGQQESMHQVLLQIRHTLTETLKVLKKQTVISVEESIISGLKKARDICSSVKCMLIYFLVHGIVHHEFVPQGVTVNQHFYSDIL